MEMKKLVLIVFFFIGFGNSVASFRFYRGQTCVREDESCARNGHQVCKEPASYLGNRNRTKTGKTCQAWNSTTPHQPHHGSQYGDTNFCRNPDGDQGPWCYTTDPDTRWEWCFPTCPEPPTPTENRQRINSRCSCPATTTYSASDLSDELKSPNYPNEYCDNLRCRWIIKPGKPGTGIRLHIESFETESSADYLDIIYVNQVMEQKLARLTGNLESAALPRYTISSDGGLELMFRTDGSVTRPGFLATFSRFNITEDQCACPNFLHTATDEETTVTSPNYPKNYCHNLQCYYFIQATPPHSVEIKFHEFEVENRYDSLSIYDGNTTERSALIEKLTGTVSATKTITSHKNSMMLVFRSDADTGHKGFRATFKRVEGPCICKNLVHSGSNGHFHSPGFPATYCSNINCTYGVSVPGHRILQIEFEEFQLGRVDSLLVPSRLSGYRLPLMKWKGSGGGSSASTRFTFDGHQANFRLETATSPLVKGGFNATYRAITRASGCSCPSPNPHNISEMEGSFSKTVCGPLDCFWVLNPPSTQANIISLWADRVQVHPRTDWLRIYKGRFQRLGYPDVTRTYSGSSGNNSEVYIENTLGPVMVHLHTHDTISSESENEPGFTIRYKWHIQNCNCGPQNLVATETVKNLTSPGFPVPYCNNLSCKYKITTTAGYRILMKIVEMRTETGDTDNLGIYDGETTARPNRLALMRGRLSDNAVHEFRSNGTTMHVWFTSDGSVVYKGYRLTYQQVPVLHQPETVRPQTVVITNTVSSVDTAATGAQPKPVQQGASVPCTWDSNAMVASVQSMAANLRPHQTGWAFATGFLLGLLLALVIIASVILTFKFGKCRRNGSSATVSYKRHPSHTYIENQAYMANENGMTDA